MMARHCEKAFGSHTTKLLWLSRQEMEDHHIQNLIFVSNIRAR